ncbi:heavy-metal-associated domain-containing protein [Streptomyces sp. NPDC006624]|uniref:heavy-metal-associated domain-containing protein n=1 Tax=unclassified Streptomyces TaxID=2593676 RepID=UPI0033B3A053
MSSCCTPNGSCHTSTAHQAVYQVEGIGSAHCQGVVTDAVSALDGVTAVTVEIGTGLVTVTTGAEADEAFDALVAETVDAAGYDFAGRVPA